MPDRAPRVEGNARMPSSLSLEGRPLARALFRAERSTNPPTAARKPMRQRWRHGGDLSPTPASRRGRRLVNGLRQSAGSGSEAMTPRRDGAGIKEPTPSFTADGLPSGTAERKSAKRAPYPATRRKQGCMRGYKRRPTLAREEPY